MAFFIFSTITLGATIEAVREVAVHVRSSLHVLELNNNELLLLC
jgi:hypothetical protein